MARPDGSRFEPRDADAQVLVLYWWASTCPLCAATSPHLEHFWRTHASRPGWMLLGLPVTLIRGRDGRLLLVERGRLFPEDIDGFAQWL